METKRRRIRFHRRLSLVLALLLSLSIAVLLLKRSAFLPYQFNKFVNEHYLKDTPFRFSCAKVSGDFVNRLVFKRLVLRYDDGHKIFPVFGADVVTVDYRLTKLLGLKLVIDELILTNVRLSVEKDESGNLVLPIPVASSDLEKEAVSPHIEVRRFDINGLQLFFHEGERKLRVRDISLSGSLEYSDRSGFLEIENGSGYLIDSETSIQSLRTGVGFGGQGIELKEFVTRLDRSFIMATGGYHNGRFDFLQFVFNPVDLKEISDMGLLPPNEGELGGNIICEGPLDSLELRGNLTGSGWGLIFGGVSFSGLLAGNELSFANVQGDIFGSFIDGRLTYEMGEGGGFLFDGRCEGLDLSQGFIPGEDTPATNFYGKVKVQYNKEERSCSFDADLDSAVVFGFESRRLGIKGDWRDGRGLKFDEIKLSRPGFDIEGSGTIDDESRTDFLFAIDGNDFDYLWDYLTLPQFEVQLGVRGRISGPMNGLRINLNGEFRNAAYLLASVDGGTIHAQVNNAPSESTSVRVDITGQKIFLGGGEFSNPHILVDAVPGVTMVRDFSFAKGDTFVSMDFDVSSDGDGSRVALKHVSVNAGDEEWKTHRPVDVFLSEGAARIDTCLLSSRYGSVGLSGSFSKEADTCNLSGWGEQIDLTLFKDAFGLPIQFQGRSNFHVSVEGEAKNPRVDLSLSLKEGIIDSIAFDRLDLRGAFDAAGEYHLDRFVVVQEKDSLAASGWWKLDKSPVHLLREGFDKDRAFASPFSLSLDARHFPLLTIFRVLHSELRPTGEFSGRVIIQNTPIDPKISLTGLLSGAEKGGIHLPDVECELSYESGLLNVEKIEFDDGATNGSLVGTLPLKLGILEGIGLAGDESIDLNCSIVSKDFSSLPPYFDQIAEASGRLSGTVMIGGFIENPSFSGEIDFQECEMRLAGMEEFYKAINARIEILGNRIELVTLTGNEGERGGFRGSGFIELEGFKPKYYQGTFHFNDFELSSIRDFSSIQDGSIAVTSHAVEGGDMIPLITGSVKIKQAQFLLVMGMETANGASRSGPTTSPGWICDIDIEAPKNFWVRNPDLRMELGGDVILKRDERGLYLRGELEVLRGTYTLYNNKFRITDGTFDFSKTNALRPEMFLNAYTPYRRVGDREHRIYLNLSWPSDKNEPEVALSYDEPGYSETDIWKMLGGTYVSPSDQTSGDTWDAAGTAQDFATNYLERMLNAQMTDVTIEVETRAPRRGSVATNGDREMSIAIGKYLSEDLYLKYSQGLSMASTREVDIEYRISNMVIIRSEIIRYKDRLFLGQSRQAADEINLDIKFRFEY